MLGQGLWEIRQAWLLIAESGGDYLRPCASSLSTISKVAAVPAPHSAMPGAPISVVAWCCICSTQAVACGSPMSDFDLVIQGRIAEACGVVDGGWIAVRDGIVFARGIGKPPSARERVDAR